MPNIFPINQPFFRITPDVHGQTGEYGAGGQRVVGTVVLQLVPDKDWIGAINVVGRINIQQAKDNLVGWQSVPYRRISIDGVASDYSFASDPLSGQALIQIPACIGLGLLFACTSGSAMVYTQDLNGPSAP